MKSAIDIGSNTCRLLVGDVFDGQVAVSYGQVITTRLAAGTDRKGPLLPQAKERTLQALQQFQTMLLSTFVATKPTVIATSAMREAANGAEFACEIAQKLGWPVKILTGEQEAQLSYLGASSILGQDVMVLDVGGGSSEFIWPTDQGIQGYSVPLGAVRLAEHPLSDAALLEALDFGVTSFPAFPLVGVGGTITALAATSLALSEYSRDAVHGYRFTKTQLQALGKKIQICPIAERTCCMPLLKDREDIILPGLAIILAVLKRTGKQEIIVSDAGILDGVLLSMA